MQRVILLRFILPKSTNLPKHKPIKPACSLLIELEKQVTKKLTINVVAVN